MKTIGIDVPQIGEKRPRPGTRVRPNKQQTTSTTNDENSEENKDESKQEPEPTEVIVEEEEEEEVKESWDAETSSEEEDDDEEEEEDEEESSAALPDSGKQPELSKSDSEATDGDSDEDSDEDDDEASEEAVKKTDALSRREKAEERIKVNQFWIKFSRHFSSIKWICLTGAEKDERREKEFRHLARSCRLRIGSRRHGQNQDFG